MAGDITHLLPVTFSTTSTAFFRGWCLAIFADLALVTVSYSQIADLALALIDHISLWIPLNSYKPVQAYTRMGERNAALA